MAKHRKVNPLMSTAFVIWLTHLGYKGVLKNGVVCFYHTVTSKNFPRDVMIMEKGRLNKPATQLFEEFKKYNPFGEVA
ncbi:hypothetical protein B9T31_09685 [Acinetobacter sp. ANC 4558]|uniref:hypothetical protein n=1 Tax=Acinetobacter sp. ANC 4558 TaxID=1977876 RepID=UPI000A34342E|nr:hypothetical protein [Acinetobacter sp. ANC 4558]OTG85854.1 hypothetical protein B9T31_09685 [Acinetobacter sp. ANC 4558]